MAWSESDARAVFEHEDRSVSESVRRRIATITVQDVLKELDEQEWVVGFKAKYGLL